MYRLLTIALSVTVLSGCSTIKTLEDFNNMSSQRRAEDVCNNANAERIANEAIKQIDAERKAIKAVVVERALALYRGYRVHKSCTSKPKTKMVCSKLGSKVTCKEEEELGSIILGKKIKSCTETPVPIDPDYEERKMKEAVPRTLKLKADRALKVSDRNNKWDECIVRVKTLPVSEAHLHYMNHTRP